MTASLSFICSFIPLFLTPSLSRYIKLITSITWYVAMRTKTRALHNVRSNADFNFSITYQNTTWAVYLTLEESTETLLLGTFDWLSNNTSHSVNDALNTAANRRIDEPSHQLYYRCQWRLSRYILWHRKNWNIHVHACNVCMYCMFDFFLHHPVFWGSMVGPTLLVLTETK